MLHITCYMEIGPPVLEKKIFEGFLPCMSMVAILVMLISFNFLIFESLHINFG